MICIHILLYITHTQAQIKDSVCRVFEEVSGYSLVNRNIQSVGHETTYRDRLKAHPVYSRINKISTALSSF